MSEDQVEFFERKSDQKHTPVRSIDVSKKNLDNPDVTNYLIMQPVYNSACSAAPGFAGLANKCILGLRYRDISVNSALI